MVCSACGQERPDGDRFCGMCGTPLPHRPLSTAGAEGTISLSRGPLETSSSHDRMSTAIVALLDVPGHNGVSPASEELLGEVPEPEPAVSQIAAASPADIAEQTSPSLADPEEPSSFSTHSDPRNDLPQESPLQDPVETLDYPPEGQTEETGETAARQPDVSQFLDALATDPAEPTQSHEAPHFPWMDGVLDEIELQAAKTPEARDERPRFLDLLGDLGQPEVERDAPAPAVVSSSLPETSEAPETIVRSAVTSHGAKPSSRKRRVWLAIAAALVFVALAGVQWRSQIARNSMRLQEQVADKIHELTTGEEVDVNSSPAATSADPVDPNKTPSQASQPEQPSKPLPENATANVGGQATTPNENPAVTKATSPAPAATQVQPPPSAQNEPEAPKFTGPGAHEMMRAEQAKTAAGRSEWLWKATARGNPDAPLQLAELYVSGDGVPRSCEQAVVLLKTAALGNNARACNRLASLYTTGTCVQRSQLEAYRWLGSALAADPNNQSAKHDRDLIWEQLTPEERTLAQESR